VFEADSTRTVFEGGVVEFRFTPPLGENERAQCRLDGGAPEPCGEGETGSFAYAGLALGRHTLGVEVSGNARDPIVLDHVIERVEPSVVVFGATPAGIVAAIAAARAN